MHRNLLWTYCYEHTAKVQSEVEKDTTIDDREEVEEKGHGFSKDEHADSNNDENVPSTKASTSEVKTHANHSIPGNNIYDMNLKKRCSSYHALVHVVRIIRLQGGIFYQPLHIIAHNSMKITIPPLLGPVFCLLSPVNWTQ